ncbi:hypothetical protein RND81_03G224200 [Saponaria officinalis]|uniref:Cytochrome b5 heme-binding domain-containing protein n=1 Tax=Saponaria officinalis TaxID=3572 RepID=A0AAW1M9J8_SAPOF
MSSDQKYKLEEVAKHNTKNDCWLVINSKVYNVTPFLDDHPGGDDVLLTSTGKDATDDFEDVGHSDNAREMLNDYYVGDIDATSIPEKQNSGVKRQVSQSSAQADQSSGFLVKVLQFLLPLLILGLAFALKKYKE